MSTRARMRRLCLGLATLAGQPRGYFIPYRYARRTRAAGVRYAAIERLLDGRRNVFAEHLELVERYAPALRAIGREPPPAPRWLQDWFPRLDGAMAYAMVRRHRPNRIVEVGSGHSTRFMARAAQDEGLATNILAIDPAPRAALRGLSVEWLATTVPACGAGPFAALAAGDILFIDSSHILMPGTDVDFLLNDVLPHLPAGVIVHIHDIFLPDDYPEDWRWRGYNEQSAIASLLAGPWNVLFASRYVATRMAGALEEGVVASLPLPAGAFESSLWLEKRS